MQTLLPGDPGGRKGSILDLRPPYSRAELRPYTATLVLTQPLRQDLMYPTAWLLAAGPRCVSQPIVHIRRWGPDFVSTDVLYIT